MSRFRVALSADFRNSDGSPAYPVFDLSPLETNPEVEIGYVAAVDGVMPAAALEGYDALILLVPRFARDSVPADGRLAMVARFGVGFDNVDIQACSDNAIAAVITPEGVRRPVAVSIVTFILALSGRLMIKDRLTRQGAQGWAQRSAHMGEGLIGKTLGQVGMGNIGAETFRMAAPFGMSFIAHDPYGDAKVAAELGVRLVGLDEVFREADFVSISCPLNDATRGLVNAERIALMKPTAYIINTARGPIVDQAALTAALSEGRIAGAGLDVFEDEPSRADDPLFKLDNVIVTPHSLCWTDQCFAGIGACDVAAALAVMRGAAPAGVVNADITRNSAWLDKLAGYKARFGA